MQSPVCILCILYVAYNIVCNNYVVILLNVFPCAFVSLLVCVLCESYKPLSLHVAKEETWND